MVVENLRITGKGYYFIATNFNCEKGQDAKYVDLILKDCSTTDNSWFNSQ